LWSLWKARPEYQGVPIGVGFTRRTAKEPIRYCRVLWVEDDSFCGQGSRICLGSIDTASDAELVAFVRPPKAVAAAFFRVFLRALTV
jgi:hypothetical protein